jgi:oxygen-independent coproporphyrinogen-3 oxidase
VDKFHLKEAYMKALLVQLRFELERFCASTGLIESVFIGGGTPSTVHPKLYEPIFKLLKPYFKEDIEITSEANPNSATKEWLEGMMHLGVNRISFGVQSFDEKKLKLLNRAHKSRDAIDAIKSAKEVGFENISLDLIYATMGDTKELLQNDLDKAFLLPINHISLYALTIEENTPFASTPELSNEKIELTKWLFDRVVASGFEHYEISNFGSYKSVHNLGYWKYKDYIGLGSGGVGKLGSKRYYPTSIVEEYIKNPLNIKTETLSNEDKKMEKIFLGFRSCVGVDMDILNEDEKKNAKILLDAQKLELKKNFLYNYDYLLADEIALFLSS